MNQKFLVVLVVTVFYNGVTCLPVENGKQLSEVSLPEEKPPTISTVTSETPNRKLDTSAPATVHAVQSGQQHPTATIEIHHLNTSLQLDVNKNTTVKTAVNESVNAAKDTVSTKVPQNVQNNTKNNITVAVNETLPVVQNSSSSISPASVTPVPINTTSVIPLVANATTPTSTVNITTANTTTTATSAINTTTNATGNTTTTTTTTTVKTISDKVTVTTPIPVSDSVFEHNSAAAQEKHFDGPSFIGGIVLTIGLTAIGFIAFKYYKSGKINMNYRTL